MDFWQALIIGIVEGFTEYLPVSSTGHVLLTQRLLGIESSEAANAFAIVVQAGAIVAVLGLYRERSKQLALGLIGRSNDGRKLALRLAVAFLPAAILGLTCKDMIEARLFGLWPIVCAWAAGGGLILAIANRVKNRPGESLETLGYRGAWIIGLLQCTAMWPGVSRSLATILAGLLVGLSLGSAVEFSFLLGLLTLGAATAYKTLDSAEAMLAAYQPLDLAIGFLVAWASAWISVKWMVGWLNQHGIALFGWWRLIIATAVAGALLTGFL